MPQNEDAKKKALQDMTDELANQAAADGAEGDQASDRRARAEKDVNYARQNEAHQEDSSKR